MVGGGVRIDGQIFNAAVLFHTGNGEIAHGETVTLVVVVGDELHSHTPEGHDVVAVRHIAEVETFV